MEVAAGALNAFEIIVERASTDKEKQFLYRLRKDLNISDRDPVWQICMMNEAFLVRLLEISNAIHTAGMSNVEAINKMASLVKADVTTSAQQAVATEMATSKSDMHRAAVKAFSGLAEEAKQVVIKAGQDISAIDKENAKAQVIQAQTKLLHYHAFVGIGIFFTSIIAGSIIGYGFNASETSAMKDSLAAAEARVVAAQAQVTATATGAAAEAAAAADAATKKIAAELAAVRASGAWVATTEGAKVARCGLPGWRVQGYTDGTKMCVTNEAVKNLIGKDTPEIGFWLPTTKKK